MLSAVDRDRDSDRERDRDPIFRIRERRWLDSALREEAVSRLDRDRQDGLLGLDARKTAAPPPTPLSFGEELQYWCDKVRIVYFYEALLLQS